MTPRAATAMQINAECRRQARFRGAVITVDSVRLGLERRGQAAPSKDIAARIFLESVRRELGKARVPSWADLLTTEWDAVDRARRVQRPALRSVA